MGALISIFYYALFLALKSSSLGTTNAIMQGSPIIVMVMGHFFLNDKFTSVRGCSAICLIAGIVLNAIPTNVTSLQPEVHLRLHDSVMTVVEFHSKAVKIQWKI